MILSKCSYLLLASIGFAASLFGQAPDPAPQFTVTPRDGSTLVTETTNAFDVAISNFALFTNVTVVGAFDVRTNIPFLDDGRPPDKTATNGTFSANIITPDVGRVATQFSLTLVVSADVLLPITDPPADPNTVLSNVIVTITNSYVVVPRPENDKFANAYKLPTPGGTVRSTNNYASLESGEPAHAGLASAAASVWWTWSSANNTNVLVDLAGSTFDGVLAVYTGGAVSSLKPVASASKDTNNNLRAHVNFDAQAGTTYRIAVAGASTNEAGNVYLRVAPGWLPDTNGPLAAIVSPETESLYTTNLVTFTGTAEEVQPNGIGVQKVFLKINGGAAVDATGTTDWSVQLDLPPKLNTIEAFAQDIAGNVGPPHAINVTFMNPTNDSFASPIELVDLSGTVLAINGRATREVDEPVHAGNEGGHSIWYRFHSPVRGALSLSTTNSDFDTLLSVFSGDSLTNLTPVASNDDIMPGVETSELRALLASNVVYYIAVDGYAGASGWIKLGYSFSDIERYYSLTVTPPLGGAVNPGDGVYVEGTPVELNAIPASNFEFVGWDGDIISTNNPLTVVMSADQHLSAIFRVKAYTEGFESGGFGSRPWITRGDAPWSVESGVAFDGSFAARSGLIGDLQTSSLVLTENFEKGTGAFRFRVSSEEGWDFLEFHVNGARLQRWSGVTEWETYLFGVPAGMSTLEWRYVRDANHGDELDAAFIDNVYLPLLGGFPVIQLSVVPLQDGTVQINGQGGPANQPQIIEASTDLTSWTGVMTNATPDGAIQWIDPQSGTFRSRYYRVRLQ